MNAVPTTSQGHEQQPPRTNRPRSDGHIGMACASITALATGLAAGLGALGLLDQSDRNLAAWFAAGIAGGAGASEAFPNRLPMWLPWVAVVLFANLLSAAILASPGWERRLLLWFATTLVAAAWAPVLCLAAFFPQVSAVVAATAWAGMCACVYAANHRMPADFNHS